MIIFTAKVSRSPHIITINTPESLDETVDIFVNKLHGGPAVIQMKKWYQARTTGWKSQNHHINGHIAQISQELGIDFDTVKLYLKNKAIARGYPYDILDDCVYPWSETRIDTLQAGFLIDEIHQFSAERDIKLIEEEF